MGFDQWFSDLAGLCFQQHCAVVTLLWPKDWQGREPAVEPAPPRPAGSLGCREHCWAPVAWLLWCSPSPLASCDSLTRQHGASSAAVARLCAAPSSPPGAVLPASRLLSRHCTPRMQNTLRFPERPPFPAPQCPRTCCPSGHVALCGALHRHLVWPWLTLLVPPASAQASAPPESFPEVHSLPPGAHRPRRLTQHSALGLVTGRLSCTPQELPEG